MKLRDINIPNRLTLLRFASIPIIIAVMLIDVKWFDWLALVIFVMSSFTDMLDGRIARKRGIVTNFGKLMDPLADKIMIVSILIVLVSQNRVNPIAVIIIVMRELAVTGLRAVAASSAGGGRVIAASIWGKLKTVSQMLTVALLLIDSRIYSVISFPIIDILVVIMTALTLVSGAEYFIKAKDCFNDC